MCKGFGIGEFNCLGISILNFKAKFKEYNPQVF